MKKALPLILALALATFSVSQARANPAANPAVGPVAPAAAGFAGGKGKVLETMDASGYTYVNVDLGGKPVWVAAPQFKVKKGQTVTVQPGAPMVNFRSKTLNRTFDVVYFVGGCEVDGTAKKK